MSRNPYLAASRPASSFTRSSRTSGRSGLAGAGGLLGRSRSSATLSSHFSSATGGGSYLSASSYVPPTWQRSSSSTRANTSGSRYGADSSGARKDDEPAPRSERKSSDESVYAKNSNNSDQRPFDRSNSSLCPRANSGNDCDDDDERDSGVVI